MSVLTEDLRAEIERWRRGDRSHHLLPETSVEAALALAELALQGRGDAGTGGAAGLLDTLRLIDEAHKGWTGKLLGPAESLAAEVLSDVEARVRAEGWPVGRVAPLPPVLWVESVESPLVWRRDLTLPLPSLASRLTLRLPFALVVMPSDHLRRPWRLASVAHEAGHVADAAFGLGAKVRSTFAAEGRAQPKEPRWLEGWLGEVVADLVGLAGVGPVFGDVLRWVVGGLPRYVPDGDASHPPLRHRLALLRAAWAVLASAPDDLADLPADVAEDARVLVGDDVLGLRKVLRVGPGEGAWGALPLRAVTAAKPSWAPGAGEPTGASAEQRARTGFRSLPALPSALGRESLAALREFWTERVPRLAATALETTGSMRKLPPPELFAEYDELYLVGATHRSLVPALDQGLKRRKGVKWSRIEVYFLGRDEDLPGIYAGEDGDPVATRNSVLATLPADLERFTDRRFWGRHPSSTLFASFMHQPAAPGLDAARWYVHTSAAVWGQSIVEAPSADYRSVSDDLSGDPEIRVLLAGLRHLRREAGCTLPFPGDD